MALILDNAEYPTISGWLQAFIGKFGYFNQKTEWLSGSYLNTAQSLNTFSGYSSSSISGNISDLSGYMSQNYGTKLWNKIMD